VTRALVVVIALATIVCSVARAEPEPAAVERAKTHFNHAKAYQASGEFARAADEYKAAYELDPHPEMLFNVGQAFMLAGAKREALDYFKRYLDDQPDGSGADEARRHVARLTAETDEGLAHRPEPMRPTTARLPPDAATPIAPAPMPADRPAESDLRRNLRLGGAAAAGVGVLALGLGVKLGFDASADANRITTHVGAWTDADRATYEAGQTANRNMGIAYAVGGGLVAAGATMYWLGARRVSVSAIVTTGGASASVMGSF
jgi:tetratricopeptide (TPR) repeat protein